MTFELTRRAFTLSALSALAAPAMIRPAWPAPPPAGSSPRHFPATGRTPIARADADRLGRRAMT